MMSNKVAALEDLTIQDDILCTPEQFNIRLDACKSCENFIISATTKCSSTGCDIGLMASYTFKQCPLEKW